MKEIRIFYSWQSDIKGKFNRYFIEECLNSAIKNLHKEDELTIDYIVDRDTKDKEGTPDIVHTIFEKIDNSEIFLADVSIINKETSFRKTPNPNVLIELGYAAAKLEWDRIICVYNTAFGQIENLPFDIKTRRILSFKYDDSTDKNEVRRDLIKNLESAIKIIDIEKIKIKRKILEEFRYESQDIINLVLKKDAYWPVKLAEKLFEKKFEEIDLKLKNLENNIILERYIKLEEKDFFTWIKDSMNYIKRLIKVTNILFSQNLSNAFGKSNESADPIKIRNTIFKIAEVFGKVIDWESELKSIETSSEFIKDAKVLMEGWAEELIKQYRHMPNVFREFLNNKDKKDTIINVSIELKAFKNMDEISKLIESFIAKRRHSKDFN